MSRYPYLGLGFILLTACAGTPEQRPTPLTAKPEFTAPTTEPTPKLALDSDGDEIVDQEDSCPLEAGGADGNGCPAQYGYFFVRIINDERLPVPASLAIQPVVNRIVVQEDGYAGMLRPGVYHLQAQAPGYDPGEMMFEVQANQKALIELKLQPQRGK